MTPVRYGMIGGGRGAFIGGVHRTAAAIAGNWVLSAGALSSTPEKARASGEDLGLPADRNYASWAEMLEREAALPADVRIEAVAIVTPNHMHAAPAIAAMGEFLRAELARDQALRSGRTSRVPGPIAASSRTDRQAYGSFVLETSSAGIVVPRRNEYWPALMLRSRCMMRASTWKPTWW